MSRKDGVQAIMALSQYEQRKLEAIEEALVREDPRLARRFAPQRLRRSAVHLACFLCGMAMLLAGAVAAQPFLTAGVLIAVAGYVAMVGSAARWLTRRSF
jgi:hypothetical protein